VLDGGCTSSAAITATCSPAAASMPRWARQQQVEREAALAAK
jgi:hypothetical protein